MTSTETIAAPDDDCQATPSEPSARRARFTTPTFSSKIQCPVIATTTPEMTYGARNSARKTGRPGRLRSSSVASPRPEPRTSGTDTTASSTVLPVARQKTGSASMSR